MPLQRRLPKRGFTNIFRKDYSIINVKDLNRFAPNTSVDRQTLKKAGLIKGMKDEIKLLANGDISRPVIITVDRVSKAARDKIEAAGGKVVADMCVAIAPMQELAYRTVATPSAKGATYAHTHAGLRVRYGTLRKCIEAAVTGLWP